MKKTSCCLLALVGLLIALNGNAQPAPPISNCTPEPQFDYGNLKEDNCQYSFDAGNFASSNTNFDLHFKYIDENGILNRIPAMLSIDELKKKFTSIQNNIQYRPENRDIAALVMYFGMEKDQLFILFQPAIMHPIGNTNGYTWEIIPEYYTSKNNRFESISFADFSKDTSAYSNDTSEIYIIHSRKRFGHKFYHSLKRFHGDVKYCTMPFQQIFKMYTDNDSNGGCADPAADGILKFSIEATRYKRSKENYKLHVVASYNNLPEDNEPHTFRGLGADFSQMSPPNNNFVVFPPITGQNQTQKNPAKKIK